MGRRPPLIAHIVSRCVKSKSEYDLPSQDGVGSSSGVGAVIARRLTRDDAIVVIHG